MKYEFKLVYQERILGQVQCLYRTVVESHRFDFVKKEYEDLSKEVIKRYHYYDAWVLINALTDNGDFIEVIQ